MPPPSIDAPSEHLSPHKTSQPTNPNTTIIESQPPSPELPPPPAAEAGGAKEEEPVPIGITLNEELFGGA